jgi:hypothetical protein
MSMLYNKLDLLLKAVSHWKTVPILWHNRCDQVSKIRLNGNIPVWKLEKMLIRNTTVASLVFFFLAGCSIKPDMCPEWIGDTHHQARDNLTLV